MTDKYFTANFDTKNLKTFFEDIKDQLDDLSPLMKVARVFLKKTINENFNTSGTNTGDKWKEWSDKYKKRRLKMGKNGNRILSLEGELQKSITAKSGKDYAKVGTNKIYAAIHNFGGDIKRGGKIIGKMPERKFMRLDDNAVNDLYAELYLKAKEILLDRAIHKNVYGE